MTAELKKWRRIFYSLSLHLKSKFQRQKDLFITLSIVYNQISNTYLPRISEYFALRRGWPCMQLYSAVIFNSKLD